MVTTLTQDYLDKKLDELAASIQRGFIEVHGRIGTIEGHIGSFEQETRESFRDVNERIDRVYTALDGFIQLHKKLEEELVMLRSAHQRLEERLERVERQLALKPV